MKVAALYVRPDGPYANREDVDAWTEERDARLYAGPWPVVAHPPCKRWGRFAAAYRHTPGDDGGCFKAALACVREFGGVLEHPESSLAFARFNLPRPEQHGEGWVRSLFDSRGWACSVDQRLYGHATRKRTWLYWCGEGRPPALNFADGGQATPKPGETYYYVATNRRTRALKAAGVAVKQLGEADRELTPPAFAQALLNLARCSRQVRTEEAE